MECRCRCAACVQVFKSLQDPANELKYNAFLDRYKALPSKNDVMKAAMTDIAFEMTQRVWQDLPVERRGSCFFCIGGVNAVNPFSPKAVKNEIVVYASAISDDAKRIPPEEGAFYDMSGQAVAPLDLSQYGEIYMDFNGSMAFFSEDWRQRLSDPSVVGKVDCSQSS